MPNRIRESDLYRPILLLLSKAPGGWMSITQLIEDLLPLLNLSKGDIAAAKNGTAKITQIIRNIVSHRTSPSNMIGAGLVVYRDNGLAITNKGYSFLARQLTHDIC